MLIIELKAWHMETNMQLSMAMMKKYHTFFQHAGRGKGRELAGFPLLPSFPMILDFSPPPLFPLLSRESG